jgi:TolB-like protein/Flp pilus assembly protein TadD
LLHAEGIEAWYDVHVGAGEDWRVATAKALKASKIFVLLFSENAAESSDIAKELAAAVLEKKLIVPVRLQNIALDGAFLYELASRNWINAYDDTEQRLAELAKGLARLVQTGAQDASILPFDRAAGSARPTRRRSLYFAGVAVGVMVVAAALFFALARWQQPSSGAQAPPTVAANPPAPSRPAGVSIAVLPFANLSSDKDQEFFSDGMTEEISSALAKVPGLIVIGRTSAFQFKGENKDVRAIGKALGVRNLIEGSVRKDGNQVRITAQLINAADGTKRWTESYDRNLRGIFALQEEIAKAIAGALQVPLGLKPGQNLVSDRAIDAESYETYLRARELANTPNLKNWISAMTLLEHVIARDPNYAPAWAVRAQIYAVMPYGLSGASASADERGRARDEYFPKAEAAARKAIALDANSADAWSALATVAAERGNFVQAEDSYKRALQLNPEDTDALYEYGHALWESGRLKLALEIRRKLDFLDPLDPGPKTTLGLLLAQNGQYAAAIAMLKNLPNAWVQLAQVYAAMGRFQDAADSMLKITPGRYPAGLAESVARLLRALPAQAGSPQDLPALPPSLNFVYLYVGPASRALEYSEAEVKTGYISAPVVEALWYPAAAPLRKTERFKALMRNVGFVAWWRARGWPDLCHPLGADDFACN